MAKKILYKTMAYHCPRCGGTTNPKKRFCDYCGRELGIRQENNEKNKYRLLIDCGTDKNYVNFDKIQKFDPHSESRYIDCTCLEDTSRVMVKAAPTVDLSVNVIVDSRVREFLSTNYKGIRKIRFEHLGDDYAAEMECYIPEFHIDCFTIDYLLGHIDFIQMNPPILYDHVIPNEILSEISCPNCGAPITSRLGACPYCSGWSEVEW